MSYIVYRIDRYDKEPLLPLLWCFGLGVLATLPAIEMERWAYPDFSDACNEVSQTFFLAYVVIAVNEEFFKLVALVAGAFFIRHFNEPLDGIVYSVMVGMGFATAENIIYVNRWGTETAIIRAFTAVPAHLVFAIVTGYFVGLAKFNPPQRMRLFAKALLAAVVLHGTYDLLILQQWSNWLSVLASVCLYLCLVLCAPLIQEHLHSSPFRHDTEPKV